MPINVHKYVVSTSKLEDTFGYFIWWLWIGIIIPKIYNNLQDKFDEGSVQVVSNFFVTFLFGNEFVWKTRVDIYHKVDYNF